MRLCWSVLPLTRTYASLLGRVHGCLNSRMFDWRWCRFAFYDVHFGCLLSDIAYRDTVSCLFFLLLSYHKNQFNVFVTAEDRKDFPSCKLN